PHAAADAQGGQAPAKVAALQLVDQGAEDHRAGGAERVAHGDGAAVDVGLLVGDPHVLHVAHGDGGEGLVDLEEVDVVDGEPGLREGLAGGWGGAGEQDRRVGAGKRGGEDPGPRGEPGGATGRFAADED